MSFNFSIQIINLDYKFIRYLKIINLPIIRSLRVIPFSLSKVYLINLIYLNKLCFLIIMCRILGI